MDALHRLAQWSAGGYVLIRLGHRRDGRVMQEWRVNVRRDGREYTSVGETLDAAIHNAARRLSALG